MKSAFFGQLSLAPLPATIDNSQTDRNRSTLYRLTRSRRVLLCSAALIAAGPRSNAQLTTKGQPAVGTGSTLTTSPLFVDASQYSGADPCIQLDAAIAANPGATVIAPFSGSFPSPPVPLTCSVNPLQNCYRGQTVIFSPGTPPPLATSASAIYGVTAPWVIGQKQDGTAARLCRIAAKSWCGGCRAAA